MGTDSRVAHVLCGFERGGISTVLFSIIRDKKRFKKLSLIALKKTGLVDEISGEGIKSEIIPWGHIVNPFSLICILLVIKREGIKIIHTHSVIPHIYGFLIKAAAKIWSGDVSLLVHVHAEIYKELTSNVSSVFKRKVYYWGVSMALKTCDIVVANSEAVRTNLISGGVEPSKIKVVYNGVNIKEIENEVRDSNPIHLNERLKGRKLIGTIGRMTPIKNHRLLIATAKKVIREYNNVMFIIIGDGKERKTLEDMVSELDLSDNFIFTGWMDSPYSVLSRIDIFVLTSTWEGLGLVILEAMALRKPVVATAVGGVPEIIKSGEMGVLVPSGDADALAAAILRLLNDPILCRRMGEAGRGVAGTKFSTDGMVDEIEGIYASLIGV